MKQRIKSTYCLNCGSQIDGSNFCHQCGQENRPNKIPIRKIVHDFFGDYFAFDSRWFKSIVPLLVKPGFLTREYVSGKRVSYIAPLRLYIFTTLIFFLITSLSGLFESESPEIYATRTFRQAMSDSLHTILKQQEEGGHLQNREQIEQRFQKASEQLVAQRTSRVIYSSNSTTIDSTTIDSTNSLSFTVFDDSQENGISKFLTQKARRLEELGTQGEELLFKSIIDNIPKVLFLLLPVFALLLHLLYVRHSRYYVEHFIFALHIHTFVFVLLILAALIPFKAMPWLVVLGAHAYLFGALLNYYAQSWFKTVAKFSLLVTAYAICMIPASIFLVILSLLTV